MKFKLTLCLLTLLLLNISFSLKVNTRKSTSLNKQDPTSVSKLRAYYWVQKIAPGKDALLFLKNSQRFNEYKFVMVGNEFISLAKSEGSSQNIESK